MNVKCYVVSISSCGLNGNIYQQNRTFLKMKRVWKTLKEYKRLTNKLKKLVR